MHVLSALIFALPVFAVPAIERRATAPTVKLQNGTVVGSTSSGIDTFNGIPFALPPTGTLRLKRPQTITSTYGTIMATGTPTACPQFMFQANLSSVPEDALGQLLDTPFFQTAQKQGEDCLTLNVQRPSNTTASSKLPVLAWIYGGGFEFGSTQSYDASKIIQKATSLGKEILYVQMNYRVAGFGFLAGKELQKDGSTNLGLRDQRLALEWIQENIAAFGGDPTKVTIWGESAGSISVFDQTIINGGDNSYKGGKLFRGAIMDSGSIVPTTDVSTARPQAIYDTVVSVSGCSGATDTLACLRTLPYTTFLNAVNSVPGIFSYRSLDLSYLPRPDPMDNFFSQSPEIPIQAGNFTKVPIIIGDQQDEGTLFALEQVNITTTDDVVTYLASYFPLATRAQVQGLVDTYPDDPAAGSPYGTGLLYNIYPQYKRLAAILGDITFILTRRVYLDIVSSTVPSWSYLATYDKGLPLLGTFHATDILEVYDEVISQVAFNSIVTYYVSFIYDLNPNAISTAAPLIEWPNWTNASANLIDFAQLQNTIIPDNFRESSYNYLIASTSAFRV